MPRAATRRSGNRMVLVGDAARFVDSINGAGRRSRLTRCCLLGRQLPQILPRGVTQKSLQAYEREAHRVYRVYRFVTNGLLMIARHPRTRRTIINSLMRHPAAFRTLMSGARCGWRSVASRRQPYSFSPLLA